MWNIFIVLTRYISRIVSLYSLSICTLPSLSPSYSNTNGSCPAWWVVTNTQVDGAPPNQGHHDLLDHHVVLLACSLPSCWSDDVHKSLVEVQKKAAQPINLPRKVPHDGGREIWLTVAVACTHSRWILLVAAPSKAKFACCHCHCCCCPKWGWIHLPLSPVIPELPGVRLKSLIVVIAVATAPSEAEITDRCHCLHLQLLLLNPSLPNRYPNCLYLPQVRLNSLIVVVDWTRVVELRRCKFETCPMFSRCIAWLEGVCWNWEFMQACVMHVIPYVKHLYCSN